MTGKKNSDAARLYVDEYMKNKDGDTAHLVCMKIRTMFHSPITNRSKLAEALCAIGENFREEDDMIEEGIDRLYKDYTIRIPN